MITDKNGREYKFIGADRRYTHMSCPTTGAVIKVANDWFTACGFKRL